MVGNDEIREITFKEFRRYLESNLLECAASEDDEGATLLFKDGRRVRIFAGGEVILG